MIKLVIFDMDGTLLDSSRAMTHSVNYVRNIMGLKLMDKAHVEYQLNQPDGDLPMLLYGTKEYTKEQQSLFRKHYLDNSPAFIKPYDGAIQLLEYLKSKNISLSIATNAPDFFAKHMLEACHLEDFFSSIVGANNVEKTKPDPEMLELLCQKFSVCIDESIFIGDSIKDEMAAKNANMEFIFADWGYGKSKSAKHKQENIYALHSYFLKNVFNS